MFEKFKAEYRASLKSMDTEEHIDLCFYRPLGFAWACLFRRLHITPNAVTIASIFIGIGAGICLYPDNIWINIGGMALLIWANSFDSADGQLARLTRQYSRIGRILDGMAGDMWFIAIYVAIVLRGIHSDPFFNGHSWIIWCLAVAAGICHARQAAIADSYRQLHLFFVKGSGGSELDDSATIRHNMDTLSWRHNFTQKLIMACYYRYTQAQEAGSFRMRRLLIAIHHTWPDGTLPSDLAARFREMSLPMCKWENFLTFNWRSIFLFITVLIGMPWLYFVIELTLFNIVLLVLIRRHETACLRMTEIIFARNSD